MKKLIYLFCLSIFLCGSLPACVAANQPASSTPIVSDSIADIVAKYRQAIPQEMKRDKIPGLSISVVDDQGILWTEGFGYTDWDRKTAVTPDTLFSIQSMSKSFTATAAMFAAQDGLVDLDAPITTYLPDFHVNSIFEEHPEQKMTLRMLLSHTAGFTHETSYGGNFDFPAYSFEKHIASISDTWLKFPVGTRYSYSNLGIDLAGYILQVRTGMPFIQYVQEKVLDPLGMKNSTLDVTRVRANLTRGIGHTGGPFRPPVDFLLIPSGGVWTTAADMAHYLLFHINRGAYQGTRLLREDMAETMYTPPNVAAHLYAQGIIVSTRNGARHFEHGGGGFGFNSEMIWYPDLKLGVVVLSNADTPDAYVVKLGEGVLDDIIKNNAGLYSQRAMNVTHVVPAYLPSLENNVLSDYGLEVLIESKALPEDAGVQSRARAVAGKYILMSSGFPQGTLDVSDTNGKLEISGLGDTWTAVEVKPGLYFSTSGDAFDVRGPTPLAANIHMVKANPRRLPFKVALYGICGLIFLSALFFWPIRALIRGLGKKKAPVSNSAVDPARNPWLVWASASAALASLFSLLCLVVIAFAPNLIYLPWPHPFTDLLWWQKALLDLPFASLVCSAGIILIALLFMRNVSWRRASRRVTCVVGLALMAFNLVILL
jgi:CubicO group peptidase (beta-lactamase class C family)